MRQRHGRFMGEGIPPGRGIPDMGYRHGDDTRDTPQWGCAEGTSGYNMR